jgi:5-carboxymethyl-2-hydroxymuconate isomerase
LRPGIVRGRPALLPAAPDLPVVQGNLIGIGLNYRGPYSPEAGCRPEPLVFGKFATSLTGHGCSVAVPQGPAHDVVCEGELAIVIGSRLHKAQNRLQAVSAVAGLTVANDLSDRALQASDIQSTRGKSSDGFCPLGPELVSLNEFPTGHSDLSLVTTINGRTVQKSRTSQMVFDVEDLVLFCSHFMTLYPGDVILTGTPAEQPDSALAVNPGDVVEVAVEGIGTLRTHITAR